MDENLCSECKNLLNKLLSISRFLEEQLDNCCQQLQLNLNKYKVNLKLNFVPTMRGFKYQQ